MITGVMGNHLCFSYAPMLQVLLILLLLHILQVVVTLLLQTYRVIIFKLTDFTEAVIHFYSRKRRFLTFAFCFVFGFCFLTSKLLSQISGNWHRLDVCDHCNKPVSVVFADERDGFLVAFPTFHKANYYKTSDGGISWQNVGQTFQNVNFPIGFSNLSMSFDSSGFIIAESLSGSALSLDTGFTWSSPPFTAAGRESAALLDKDNPSHILVLGGDFFNGSSPQLLVSHDTGNTFKPYGQIAASLKTTHSACIQDSTNVWFTASDPRHDIREELYHTLDGGQNWKQIFPADTSLTGNFLFNVVKGADKNTVYLAGGMGKLQILGQNYDFFFTTDNGTTWSGRSGKKGNFLWPGYYLLCNPKGSELWSVLDDQYTVIYSPDNGLHWQYDSVTFHNDSIVNMIWQDSMHGYILAYQDSTIHLYTYSQANSASYFVNYIHAPFKIMPSITSDIIHVLPLQDLHGLISIHDIFGRTILQERLNTSQNVQIDYSLAQYSTGVYYISYYSGDYSIFFKVIKE
jgi:photosystem II stability/assembly factor-like uncharacterized protein